MGGWMDGQLQQTQAFMPLPPTLWTQTSESSPSPSCPTAALPAVENIRLFPVLPNGVLSTGNRWTQGLGGRPWNSSQGCANVDVSQGRFPLSLPWSFESDQTSPKQRQGTGSNKKPLRWCSGWQWHQLYIPPPAKPVCLPEGCTAYWVAFPPCQVDGCSPPGSRLISGFVCDYAKVTSKVLREMRLKQ